MSQGVLYNVIIRYPHLVEPWSSQQNITPDFNCQLVFPKDWAGWQSLQDLVNQAIAEKFPKGPPANMKMPWLNQYLQPKLQKDGPYEGCYFLSAAGKGTKPGVVGPDAQPFDDQQTKQFIFSGCVVNALVGFYGYQTGSTGVGCALNGVQLVNNKMEPIPDAGRNVQEAFQAIPGAPPAVTPAFQGQTQPQAPVPPKTDPFG